MATDLQITKTPDLLVDNEVCRLHRGAQLARVELSGAGWLTKGSVPKISHELALCAIFRLVRSKWPEYRFWLLACHSTWQTSNQVTKYNKLWKSLKKGRAVEERAEGLIEENGQLRYFSAIELEQSDEAVVAALAVVHEECASSIVAMPPGNAAVAESLVTGGWPLPEFQRPSGEVLAAVTKCDGIVLHPLGVFDDFEAGYVAIANPLVVQRLLESVDV